MLEQTFVHLPGIGASSEAKLKEAGICSWDDALNCTKLPLRPGLGEIVLRGIEESQRKLEEGDALWFSERLNPAEQWRLFPHFSNSVAYVDIETTGFSYPDGHITSIALFNGQEVKVYVHGDNLPEFVDDIKEYQLFVSWNGRCFDAPFIRRSFNIELKMAHLDLYPVYRALGYKGGLKKVEEDMGLDRGDLKGVDGYMAVLLWQEYIRSGNKAALETLLAYNIEDVLSLDFLSREACVQHGCSRQDLGFSSCTNVDELSIYRADKKLVQRLISKMR